MTNFPDRYGRDVLSASPHPKRARSVETAAEPGLVVEDVETGFCGAVVQCDKYGVTLEDRHGKRRAFPLGPGFWLDGKPVALVRPSAAAPPAKPTRTASGSRAVDNHRARTARESRIYVEGKHDAELVEKIWGDDLRVEGVVVEELGGADDLADIIREFEPGTGRRLGVLLDHLVSGTKETRIAEQATKVGGGHVLIVGHPYVDVWEAVRPSVLGIDAWPAVPKGVPWKEGVIQALEWSEEPPAAWRRILAAVRTYTDLEPSFLGRVEELIDFVTAPSTDP
ncbi:DUF3097 domain-containing protein [Phytoactinopolyspora mesophila]|uniref:DUF3097 domain-containing protein n=1 Tax=Phytoactinopolyspora mesophila TaxID=2650750 RepID=UPI003CCDA1F2